MCLPGNERDSIEPVHALSSIGASALRSGAAFSEERPRPWPRPPRKLPANRDSSIGNRKLIGKLVGRLLRKFPRKLSRELVQELIWKLPSILVSSHSALFGSNLSLNLELNLSLFLGLNLDLFLALNLCLNLNLFLILNLSLNFSLFLTQLPSPRQSLLHPLDGKSHSFWQIGLRGLHNYMRAEESGLVA
jgi:hypothetical protein